MFAVPAALTLLMAGGTQSLADHGGPHVLLLARGAFVDDVAVQVRNHIAGRGNEVFNLRDASDIVVLEITLDPGAVAPWHTHSGTGLLVNKGPGILSNVLADDCVVRQFAPGEALVDPGHGSLHAAWNASSDPLVLIAIFIGVHASDPPVIGPAPPPFDCPVLP